MSPNPPRADLPEIAPALQQEVARLAAAPDVRSAFNWFRVHEPQLLAWQMEMARIPAPPLASRLGRRGWRSAFAKSGSTMSALTMWGMFSVSTQDSVAATWR